MELTLCWKGEKVRVKRIMRKFCAVCDWEKSRIVFLVIVTLVFVATIVSIPKDVSEPEDVQMMALKLLFPDGDETNCKYQSQNFLFEGKCSQLLFLFSGMGTDEEFLEGLQTIMAIDYFIERDDDIIKSAIRIEREMERIGMGIQENFGKAYGEFNQTQQEIMREFAIKILQEQL